MVVFKKVVFRNFLSSGNQPTEIILDGYQTTLITGTNGSGKSTLLCALCFALFGRPFRSINKGQVINSINGKNCLVEVQFIVNGHQYLVRRGIKPNIFEIYCDEELINQEAAVKDYQKVLEQQILKLNYKTFTQVVILGSATFVPFMQLPSSQRREVIEDILDIRIFSVMNSLLKEKIASTRDSLHDVESAIENQKIKTQAHKKIIDTLESNKQEHLRDIQVKIEQNQAQIDSVRVIIEGLVTSSTSLKNELMGMADVNTSIQQATKMKSKLDSLTETQNHNKKFFTLNTSCPTCSQSITEEHKNQMVGEIDVKLDDLNKKNDLLKRELEKLQSKLQRYNEVADKLKEISIDSATQTNKIKFLTDQNSQLQKEMLLKHDDGNLEEEKKTLKLLAEQAIELVRSKEQYLNEKQLQDTASLLLKDTGIKTAVVKQYLPVMNRLINKYLSAMDFFVQFELDESFNEVIKSRGRDTFSYSSFSEGEKQRINLAIMICWRQIAKMKNSVNTNLLIMDEIMDSSLDGAGLELMMGLLGETNETNTIIISHREVDTFKFDRQLRVKKIGDFTSVEEASI